MNPGQINLLLLVVLIIVMWLIVFRPQRKRDKEVAHMRANLSRGDKFVTVGGITGRILKVGEDSITIQTGPDKVKLETLKSSVGSVVTSRVGDKAKSETVKEKAKDEEPAPAKVSKDKKVTPKNLQTKNKTEEVKSVEAAGAVDKKVEENK